MTANSNDSTFINDLLYNKEQSLDVVWQVTEIADFQRILVPFITSSAHAGQKTVYIHFSEQALLSEEIPKTTFIHIPLTHRFEAFTVAVYQTVLQEDPQTFFIFDCLSDLQTAWATDLMMENFFHVIIPAIRQRKAKAFFPIIRGMHSFHATEEIRQHTQVFLNLYADFKHLYMRPEKVLEQTKGSVFMPHIYDSKTNRFRPILDGVLTSRFHKAMHFCSHTGHDQHMDSWDRFFDNVQRDVENGRDVTGACNRMCNIMMSRDVQIRELIQKHFRPEDYFFVKEHMIGTGLIGGKACGMLTARKIIEDKRPDIYENLEAHDSFFIGSDVFYSYIVENDLWDIRVRQRTKEGYFTLADDFASGLFHGTFSPNMEEAFIHLLEYYGQSPVIVRSSSILEDGFGNAFAGKYDSVFCPGVGSMEERLKEFEDAIRVVYASTMSRSALDYRLRRGLNNRDEQMALLVQRVSGSHYGDYFMPCAAGVGYSYSTYRFLESLNPQAGMLRLVMGLGTSAVDRTEGSYPRLVSLDKPTAVSFKSIGEHHRFSQQNIELINKATGKLEQVPYSQIESSLPLYLKNILLEHDYEAERLFRERGIRRDICFISCGGLVKNTALMKDMQEMMAMIQEEYQQPVDIEFTMNLSEEGEYVINLLQCRPLQVFEDRNQQVIPETLDPDSIFIDCSHASMGLSQKLDLDYILYVDPIAYYNMPYHEKDFIAKIIGEINWYYRGKEKKMLLLVPGRIGTSSPELGVPTTFSDISEFSAIFEISESKVGYSPELSYGSHMFQDLVENHILYLAIFEDERTKSFLPEKFLRLPNHAADFNESAKSYENIIGFYDVSRLNCCLYHDLLNEHLVCTIKE